MASTLLSGANIVYNGNPLNDLSLAAFLIKFMEKKPKEPKWHGGSQIEPARQLDMNHHLIGSEILSLAETDVAPEDFVFHKFYMNKMDSTKKSKKKKKKATEDDDATEDLLGMHGGDDDSDNEEIENMLDAADATFEKDGDYDYDDLDQVADEDDDDLVGNVSDNGSDLPEGEDFDMEAELEDDDGPFVAGDEDGFSHGDEDTDPMQVYGKRKRKGGKKSGTSPFASADDYQHLLKDDGCPDEEDDDDGPAERKRSNRKKKNKKKKYA